MINHSTCFPTLGVLPSNVKSTFLSFWNDLFYPNYYINITPLLSFSPCIYIETKNLYDPNQKLFTSPQMSTVY
jgi:hypothetical protein